MQWINKWLDGWIAGRMNDWIDECKETSGVEKDGGNRAVEQWKCCCLTERSNQGAADGSWQFGGPHSAHIEGRGKWTVPVHSKWPPAVTLFWEQRVKAVCLWSINRALPEIITCWNISASRHPWLLPTTLSHWSHCRPDSSLAPAHLIIIRIN